ncbi:MAG: FAD-dependent oxidoreductase [Thermoanaerobaculia bacterium]
MAAPHVAVLGAGAFGGWTALHLLRGGARVTLIDPWGPGHSRASSGGETRIIRGVYGPDRLYLEWTARAFGLWQEAEERFGIRLLHRTGVLWLCAEGDPYVRDSVPYVKDAGLEIEEMALEEARRRFPRIDLGGVGTLFFEPGSGYLLARRACQVVAEAFAAEGGELRSLAASPGPFRAGRMEGIALSDGSTLRADLYVFACGPWLGTVFPEVIGEDFLRVSRQEVFFFGTPADDPAFDEGRCPAWIDLTGERIFYGMPGNEHRGFKVADDTRGEPFDPTSGERLVTPEALERARDLLARRFPALQGAPLVETRVCQYENSPDGHLLFDRHPEAENVWLLGGGSGHGFKLSPALGEYAARILLEDGAPEALLSLDRPSHVPGAPSRTQFDV